MNSLRLPTSPASLRRSMNGRGSGIFFGLCCLLFSASLSVHPLHAQFSYDRFDPVDTMSLCLAGDATLIPGGVLRLTPDAVVRNGAVWHSLEQSVGYPFTLRFQYRMGKEGGGVGADGFAAVFYGRSLSDQMFCPIGAGAKNLGYGGLPSSLAIEFDTFFNETDPNGNHIAVHSRGRNKNSPEDSAMLAYTTNVPTLADGEVHLVIIDYDGTVLRIYLDECTDPVLAVTVDLTKLLQLGSQDRSASVGLTAATGTSSQNHDILSWEFTPVDLTTDQLCFGDSATLIGPAGLPTYRWSTGDSTQAITVYESGHYELEVFGYSTCPDSGYRFVFDVVLGERKERPYLEPNDDVTLCPGDSLVVNLGGLEEGDAIVWWNYRRAIFFFPQNSPTYTIRDSGIYYAVITDENGCTYVTDSVEVALFRPRKPELPDDRTICGGNDIRLDAGDAFLEYEWSTGSEAASILVMEPGTYWVKTIDSNGCRSADTIVIADAGEEELTIDGDTVICRGFGTNLAARGRTEYEWTPATGLSCTDCPNPKASPKTTTTYVVRGSSNGDCVDFDTITIRVLDLPEADAGSDRSICVGDTIPLQAEGGVAYRWVNSGTLSCANCRDPKAFPRETTTYLLQVTGANGCIGWDSVTVTVEQGIELSVSDDAEICPGGEVILSASGADSYRWESSGTSSDLTCVNCAEPTARPTVTTTYYVIGTDASGLCSGIDSVTVIVRPLPLVDAGPDGAVCVGGSVRLAAVGGESLRWDRSPDLSCLDCPDPVATPSEPTTYYVTATDPFGCEARDSVRVDILPPPTIDAGPDRTICGGDSTELAATGGVRWLWEPADGLSCTDCPDPVAAPGSTTRYRVTAWNEAGCAASDDVTVGVRDVRDVIRLRIGRDFSARPGMRLEIPVLVTGGIPTTDIESLTIELEYDPSVMSLGSEAIEGLLTGTILEGWTVVPQELRPGLARILFLAPAGQPLEGFGSLLTFEGRLFLGEHEGTELNLSVISNSNCFEFRTEPGRVRLDSVCGLNFRLIERSLLKYIPPRAFPNPAADMVTFEFGLGLNGPTVLEVTDISGNRVGLIVDADLGPGTYSVSWDVGDIPSGVYWYRLRSGDWSRTGRVTVAK